MVVALGVLIAYQYILHMLYPNWKQGETPQNPAPATAQVARSQPATTQATTRPGVASAGVTTAPSAGTWRARGDERTSGPQTIGSAAQQDKNFAMAVEVFPKGAAINAVTLNEFRKTAEDARTPYTFQGRHPFAGDQIDHH
jgi:hypothetical protein